QHAPARGRGHGRRRRGTPHLRTRAHGRPAGSRAPAALIGRTAVIRSAAGSFYMHGRRKIPRYALPDVLATVGSRLEPAAVSGAGDVNLRGINRALTTNMIVYDLACEKDHPFEGWFGSADDFTSQVEAGDIACPVCGSAEITRRLSAPYVNTRVSTRPAAQQA